MENRSKFGKDYIWIISIILLSTILILLISTKKINYNIDELLSYSLSNSSARYISFTSGEKYESFAKLQESYLTPNDETKFNYQNVWEQQAKDVHPPFYYAIIHTISSLMPGVISKYIGISVNIFFNALIILLLYKFSLLLTEHKKIAYITSLFWAVNPGILSDMMFIRMYVMTMFFCLFISFVHIKYSNKDKTLNYKFYLSLFLVSLAGALTHYYFIVFNFFISALFVLLLLCWKKVKELLLYICTYILTFSSVLVIFPSIYGHILGDGDRGEESRSNFLNMDGYLQFVRYFWGVISNNIFGGYLLLFIVLITIALIVSMFRKKQVSSGELENHSTLKYVYLLAASTLYFLLISKIAVYATERYLQPIFPILILIFVPFVFRGVRLFLSKNVSLTIVSTLLLLISLNGYINTTSFDYLILDSEKAIQIAEQYSDKNSVVIYDQVWKVPPHYVELAHYESVTLYNINDLDGLYQNTDYDKFVVYSHSADDSIIKTIVEKLPKIESYKKLNTYGYCNVYYLE